MYRVVDRCGCVLALLFGLVLVGAPAPAQASKAFARVQLDEDEENEGPVTFTAEPGETNRLSVSDGRLGIVFHDRGCRVRARGACRSVERHTATCPAGAPASVRLGDRSDQA